MSAIAQRITELKNSLPNHVTLVAVSKFQPASAIEEAYAAGHRVFGENRPQELAQKYVQLPKDIEWHFLGHLQTNKIKMIIPFVSLIHSIDSLRLAEAVSDAAVKEGRVVDVLLQVHIAQEATKQGFTPTEADEILSNKTLSELKGIKIVGLMGMATFTDDKSQIEKEFRVLEALYKKHNLSRLSMGMSEDYPLAIECGSNMIRVGSSIFGDRNY